jgi:hypothetical protein
MTGLIENGEDVGAAQKARPSFSRIIKAEKDGRGRISLAATWFLEALYESELARRPWATRFQDGRI